MSPARPSLDDYIDVAERIVAFNTKYPEGSLQTSSWEVRAIGERLFVIYTALACRTAEDKRPGMGTAWEPFPGTTPYTRDSELMNAETAAWGRAIVAVGITSNRRIASRQEAQARQTPPASNAAKGEGEGPPTVLMTGSQQAELGALIRGAQQDGMTSDMLRLMLADAGISLTLEAGWMRALTSEQANTLIAALRGGVQPDPAHPSDLSA